MLIRDTTRAVRASSGASRSGLAGPSPHGATSLRAAALACAALSLVTASCTAQRGDAWSDSSVFLVLVDGLRWQEVFAGADDSLMNKEMGGVEDPAALRRRYWRDSPQARRELLMPFFWSTIARQGQLFGHAARGCTVRVSNTRNVSYPGYSEMIVGYADPRITSNARIPNPNVSVFEWLNRSPAFRGRVAAVSAWDVTPFILNRPRCGFFVSAGTEPIAAGEVSPRQALLNQLKQETPWRWGAEPFDSIVFHSAVEYILANRPRVFWLTFGETDEWAHEGRYAEYLDATLRTDRFIGELWATLQALPTYNGRVTLIVAADHGRGSGREWTDHNDKTRGSENIWVAVLGPHTPGLGERADMPVQLQAQIAATVAAAVGQDYCAAQPRAARPLEGAIRTSPRR